ncbi:hypothetical protein PSHT_13471 [Puccinia striiformis]|uniref:Uncharacterized protein n=1 Tax=Puccinia striiformis TaxID=27350 RepID=A0A2S4UQM5_9BASI|nr:hypothetical protein PSHT_13471 [Puccinia striiformis]
MAFQEAAQSFVELLQKLLNDATKACEELKMDVLENHFCLMKIEYKERQSQLTAKMNKGLSLTANKEEWIYGTGKLINGELLIGRLSALASASGNESIHLNSDNVKTFFEIHDFCPKESTKLPTQKELAAKKNDKPEKPNTEKQKVLTGNKDSSAKKSVIQSHKDSSVKKSVIPPTNVNDSTKDSSKIQTVIAAKVNSCDKQSSLLTMRMSQKAWDSVSAPTLANCWGVTKIIKNSPNSCLEVINKSIENGTTALESQLNTLESIGAVLPQNRMSLSKLLDLEGENNHTLQMCSDEEIFASAEKIDEPLEVEPEANKQPLKKKKGLTPRKIAEEKTTPLKKSTTSTAPPSKKKSSTNLTNLLETYQQKVLNYLHFKGQQAGIRDYFNPVTPQTTSTSRIRPSQESRVASTSKVTVEMLV